MESTSIARVASLIGEAGRIQMLATMLDGNGHSASELANAANVSPQTASSHLSKLLSGELIVCERNGRQRLFRLKNANVAAAIEALGAIAQSPENASMPGIRFARSCYDHLAGVLAIALRNELIRSGALRHSQEGFALTSAGKQLLRMLDVDTDSLKNLRRSFATKCLDWTERHHHLGGAVGATLLSRFIERKWLARMRDTRALRLTQAGERGFEHVFGVHCAELQAASRVSTR